MSLFHATRLFKEAMTNLAAARNELTRENHAAIYNVVQGLTALSDGLEQESRQIKDMLPNIHQALIDSKGPEADSR
jgi:hypothetical protein